MVDFSGGKVAVGDRIKSKIRIHSKFKRFSNEIILGYFFADKLPKNKGKKIKRRTAYPLDYKLRILEEAKQCDNNRLTAKKHGLNEAHVRNWRKNEAEIRAALTTGQMFRKPGKPKSLDSCR